MKTKQVQTITAINGRDKETTLIRLDDNVVIAIDDTYIAIYESEAHFRLDPRHPREITTRR